MTEEQISETAKENRLLIREICGMTSDERQLLMQELCARLPYGLKVQIDFGEHCIKYGIDRYVDDTVICVWPETFEVGVNDEDKACVIEDVKPYLRPMSSMTEEEKNYIKNIARFKQSDGIHYDDGVHYMPIYQETLDDQWKTDGKFPPILGDIYRFMLDYGYILLIDFFNSHHLDYRGLIPIGLALEAQEGMYKNIDI
jgi:hypothetical protein